MTADYPVFSDPNADLTGFVRTELMHKWTHNKVRQTFIDFFVEKCGHTYYPSSSVIPHADPTLLFINAGMNQFKPLFLGTADPSTDFGRMTRAVNSQKCIRAGGKHNDLEDVGRDNYHHTMFEMLGNWSFGDYFKRESIEWAWELLFDVYGLDPQRAYFTYFEGDPKQGLQTDVEARDLWLGLCEKHGVPPEHVVRGNAKDNFWEMGATGPCGPCTEIHYDRIGGGRHVPEKVNKDDPNVLEIWNIVFIQYNRVNPTTLDQLPKKHVDTGAGLERMTSVLQNVMGNYDTDVWVPMFEKIQRVTGFRHSYWYDGPDRDEKATVAYRVLADHARCLTFAIADGAQPDNMGRGYVLRRIVRRAVRFGNEYLGAGDKIGFFSELVDAVAEALGSFFTQLTNPQIVARVKHVLLTEERLFAETYKRGLAHFHTTIAAAKEEQRDTMTGEEIFTLHDRFGFPSDLTCLMAEAAGFKANQDDFKAVMAQKKGNGGGKKTLKSYWNAFQVDELEGKQVAPTNDADKYVWHQNKNSKILALWNNSNDTFVGTLGVESAQGVAADEIATSFAVLVDHTNFYSEAGGQIWDVGTIENETFKFKVNQVKAFAGYIAHIGEIVSGTVNVGDQVDLKVNYEVRSDVANNHTITHQLNHALRGVLQYDAVEGTVAMDVVQRGSLCAPEYGRFDFSYASKPSAGQLKEIEHRVNQAIIAGLPVFRLDVPLAKAYGIKSLRCLFEDKYPDPVTVVSIGVPVEELLADPDNEEKWKNYSIEFCGGTHVRVLSEVQQFRLMTEEALMAGVRRVTFVTGKHAQALEKPVADLNAEFDTLKDARLGTADHIAEVQRFLKRLEGASIPLQAKLHLQDAGAKVIQDKQKELAAHMKQLIERATAAGQAEGRDRPAPVYVIRLGPEFEGEREAVNAFAEGLNATAPQASVFVVATPPGGPEGTGFAVATVPKEKTKTGNARDWIVAAIGKGGGKPEKAQGGFPTIATDEILAKAGGYASTVGLDK